MFALTQRRRPSFMELFRSFMSLSNEIITSQSVQSEPDDHAQPVQASSEIAEICTDPVPDTEDIAIIGRGDKPDAPSPTPSETTCVEPEIEPVTLASVDVTPNVDDKVVMRRRLFELLKDMQLGPKGFSIESALHQICVDPAELQRFCEVLVAPLLLKTTQPIAAVIGIGGCGSSLAAAVARRLPPCTLHKNTSAVAFLPMEKNGKHTAFIAPDQAGRLLRGKQVLIVTPILTPANVAEIQGMIHAVESELTVNANVHSIVTLLELQNCGPLTHSVGKASSIKVWSGLTLNFGL